VAIALKLFPVLLIPLLLLEAWRRRVGAGVIAAGLAAAVAVVGASFLPALAAGAGKASLSFLGYQGERGLQIESSYAGVLLLLHRILPFEVAHEASHHAHDLAGPVADAFAVASRGLVPVGVLAVTWLAWRRGLGCVRGCAAVIAAALLLGNVFSPQFMLWLVPLAAATVAHPLDRRAVLLVAAAGLTSLVFPALYPALVALRPHAGLALCARNLALFALLLALLAPRETPALRTP
jgi:hypothetical protein